jgi:hypothetical protein
MPSIAIPATTISITGAAIGALTCASTTGLYIGQKGNAVKSNSTGNIQVVISQVIDSTTFLCQAYANKNNAGGIDLSLYNGGKIYFEAQIVSVQSLYPALDSNGEVSPSALPLATPL